MAYPVASIANALLEIAWRNNGHASPMKLQKLIYLAHGLNLALYGERLIDSSIQAWKYGPVIPPLYYELRNYGASNINVPITLRSADMFLEDSRESPRPLDKRTLNLLSQVWQEYGNKSAVRLSSLTHDKELPEGKPWYKTWHEEGGKNVWGTEISDKDIEDSFRNLLVAS